MKRPVNTEIDLPKMTQQIEMQRQQSGYDREGLQQLQQELDREQYNLQRMTSEEERQDRQKMRRIFNSVSVTQKLTLRQGHFPCFFVYGDQFNDVRFIFSWMRIVMAASIFEN